MATAVGPILIVEDDPDMREAVRLLIEAKGYRSVTAADGAEALTALRSGPRPCLILLDLMMPVKDAIQFRTEQRQEPEIADIPVVVMSARTDSLTYVPLLGAVAHLRKPILNIDELLNILRQYCNPEQP